jgi:hypothetical protein
LGVDVGCDSGCGLRGLGCDRRDQLVVDPGEKVLAVAERLGGNQ